MISPDNQSLRTSDMP